MDRISNLKTEKQTIYEIYRACRLCGGGAGYKMPIVQNVIDLDTNGVELKQKIQECLQIEVHPEDKMPPLICELCVDKVNDFYDFMEMCKQINKRTRMRLGLPLQLPKKCTSESGDCILGVTEPIYHQDDDNVPLSKQIKNKKKEIKKEKDDEPLSKSVKKKDDEPLSKLVKKKDDERLSKSVKKNDDERLSKSVKKKDDERLSKLVKKNDDEPLSKSVKKKDVNKKNEKNLKDVKVKKEPEVKVKTERAESPVEPRKTRLGHHKREPTPPRGRSTRQSIGDDNVKLSSLKVTSKPTKSSPHPTKPVSSRELKELLDVKVQYKEEECIRPKRAREKEPPVDKKTEVPAKKVKISLPPKPPPVQTTPKPKPKPKRAPTPSPPPPPQYQCTVCGAQVKSPQGLANHIKAHVVTFTIDKLACNPCGEWFTTPEESSAHHRKHKSKPYRCRHCYSTFKALDAYDEHFDKEDCKPYVEVADKKCDECWREYPTQLLLERHRCQGADGRPGGKCNKCNRMYTLLKNLKKHEATCTVRKKGEAIVDPEVERRLKDTHIRLVRCDELLTKIRGDSYDVSGVDVDFGFDSNYIYPYRYRIKSEPTTGYDTMVAIRDEVKEYYSRNYVHWDSDDTDSEVDDKKRKIDSLTAISLKTIFSNKLLGKVPRRRRKVKVEKVFENNDFDMSKDIDRIIVNLGHVDFSGKNDSANDSDCSESIFGPFKNNDTIAENAFDSLLDNSSQDTEKNFDLFNSSGENKDSSNTDLGKVNDSDSDVNDKECNGSGSVNSLSKDSGVKDDESKLNGDSKVDEELESTGNGNASTENDAKDNDETISHGTELSNTQSNGVSNDDTKTDILIDDTSQNNVKENDRLDNLEVDSNEQISLSGNNIEKRSEDLDNNEKADDSIENKDAESQNQTENNEESNVGVNGQTDKNNLVNDASDSEMDDKTLMDALDASIGENIGNGDDYSDENHVENHDIMSHQNDDLIKDEINNTESKTEDIIENNGKIIDNSVTVENNDLIKHDINNISEPKTEDIVENNGKVIDNSVIVENNDLKCDKKEISDLVSKPNNLSGMDLDNISDDEFNFDA